MPKRDLVLAMLLAANDPNAENWASVAWARAMVGMSRDLGIPSALTDIEGRPIVDALPDMPTIDIYTDATEPVTLRCPTFATAA